MSKIELYESIINSTINKKIIELPQSKTAHKKHLEQTESNKIIADYLKLIIEKGLGYYSSGDGGVEKQIEIGNKLLEYLKELVEDDEFSSYMITDKDILRGITDVTLNKQQFLNVVPTSSIAQSNLFTGSKDDPMVYSELKKEIKTADRVDLLVSFIRYSGLRLLIDELVEHTKSKPLRVITTSYMSASDYSAIKLLAELPNTELRISYDTNRTRLHAKAYYFHRSTGFSTAYIGSSNISKAALTEGTEWNLKVSEHTSGHIIEKYKATFESYWNMSEFQLFDPTKEYDLVKLKRALKNETKNDNDDFFFDIRPFGYQQEILDKLEIERSIHGSFKNLIVAATGTGKTVISAFDFKRYFKEKPDARLLFLAHRKEILEQSLKTFRGVLRDGNFGDLWVGGEQPEQFNHIFASIQTLNTKKKFNKFECEHFDYIVIDETHHSTSSSYRTLIEHFKPNIFLGLTATPERLDGEDILEFFNYRTVDEIRLSEAIERKMLCPFHYFGVSEDTDFRGLKWSSGHYDKGELSNLLIDNQARDQVVLSALKKYCPDIDKVIGLGFCCSQNHAKYMSKLFNKAGIKSKALDSNSAKELRQEVAKNLRKGEIRFIFVVDLYNEGVDIPEVNTVLFLRPTESPTIFIQQLGRGLRVHEDKEVLTVLDFIGQSHKKYDVRSKFQSLVGRLPHSVKREVEYGFPTLPKSCFIQLERVAKERIFKNLKETYVTTAKLKRMVENFKHESSLDLNLQNFLNHYHIEAKSLYKYSCLCILVNPDRVKLRNKCMSEVKNVHKRLYKFNNVISLEWINFLVGYIDSPTVNLTEREEALLLMTYYTFYDKPTSISLTVFMKAFVENNPDIVRELKEILLYNKEHIDHIPKRVEVDPIIPMELHGVYTTDQILSAFGVHSKDKYVSFREGVKYVSEYNCDLFFVTLNKNKKDYQKSTMYKDYAISESLFHVQSQNRTSVNSATGQRYINQKQNGSKTIIFVREHRNDEYGQTMGYRCLGLADYVGHEGSKPISITYKLQETMPIKIYRESAKIVNII